jgi:hypothetical protein
MLTWTRVFLRWTGVSTCLGAGAGGVIRPSSVPAGLLRQHFDTFRGMILETFPSFSDRQSIHCLAKTGHVDIDGRQATRRPQIKIILPATSLFRLQRPKDYNVLEEVMIHNHQTKYQSKIFDHLRSKSCSRDQYLCQCLVV